MEIACKWGIQGTAFISVSTEIIKKVLEPLMEQGTTKGSSAVYHCSHYQVALEAHSENRGGQFLGWVGIYCRAKDEIFKEINAVLFWMTSQGNGVCTCRRTLVCILEGEKGQGKGEDIQKRRVPPAFEPALSNH